MNTQENFFDIVNGPGRDLLFDACKYAYSKITKVHVEFTVAAGYTMPKDHPGRAYIPMRLADVLIASISHENGSGESFNLRGYCRADLKISGPTQYTYYYFDAYYSVKTRTGKIKFLNR